MSELRQDRATGAWVVIAPERSRRGKDAARPARHPPPRLPQLGPACPFCPGNEHMLAAIDYEVAADEEPGWHVRAVPNRYPALRPDAEARPLGAAAGGVAAGFGHHEVLVDTPRHDLDLSTLSDAGARALVAAYRQRCADLLRRRGVRAAVLFRNRGRDAGASLAHPHSQILATGFVPPHMAAVAAWMRRRYDATRRCATCDDLRQEEAEGIRVVEAGTHFLAGVPFAAAAPCEIHITPRRHQASFVQAGPEQLAELAEILARAVRRMQAVLGAVAYNCVLGTIARPDPASCHWRLRVVPQLGSPGGFELATNMPINPASPEADARRLRDARA